MKYVIPQVEPQVVSEKEAKPSREVSGKRCMICLFKTGKNVSEPYDSASLSPDGVFGDLDVCCDGDVPQGLFRSDQRSEAINS